VSAAQEAFTFGESDEPHRLGDPDCDVGWCSGRGWNFPHPCDKEGCAGLVHANFGDENRGGDYWLYERCDVCGAG
jgi:hypothetical protein